MAATESKKQILIVDQDVAAVEPLRRRLCDAGFDVHVIAGGAAAVTALRERPPHLVILDWNAPGFAALEVIAVTQRVRVPHRVRLILLSALSSEPDVVAAFDLGADDYIAEAVLGTGSSRTSLCGVAPGSPRKRSLAGQLRRSDARRVHQSRHRPRPSTQTARRRIQDSGVFDVASRQNLQSESASRNTSGAATAKSMSGRSTSMCRGCARSSPGRAMKRTSRRCAASVTGSPPRDSPAATETWFSFLLFHAMFHA